MPLATKQCHELPTVLLYATAVPVAVFSNCEPVRIFNGSILYSMRIAINCQTTKHTYIVQ